MSPEPRYLTAFTTGTPYEHEADALQASAAPFGLWVDAIGYAPRGTWAENCAEKPRIIRDALEDRPVVWLDADARIVADPVLLREIAADVDIAYHRFRTREILTGTLYVGATPGGREIVRLWAEAQASQMGTWDQRVLQAILDTHVGRWNRALLPESYVCIDGLATAGTRAVIRHTQASRRFRRVAAGWAS